MDIIGCAGGVTILYILFHLFVKKVNKEGQKHEAAMKNIIDEMRANKNGKP